MSNVLSEEKKQQVIALGKLGLSLRQIEQATGVRRETASVYLKVAGIAVAGVGRRSAKPAIRVATDSGAKPGNEVTTDFVRPHSQKPPSPPVSTSDCEPFREIIELGLSQGRNAMAIWQDLVTDHGFGGAYNTVKRFVRKLRGAQQQPEAVGIILTGRGEDYVESRVMLRSGGSGSGSRLPMDHRWGWLRITRYKDSSQVSRSSGSRAFLRE